MVSARQVDCVWNVIAHAQKPDFVFRRNGRAHLNRRGCQFSRLMAAELCALAVVMLDTTCSEVAWRVLATHSIRQFPLHFPPVRHRVPTHFNWTLWELSEYMDSCYSATCQIKIGVWCAVSATSISGSITSDACYNIECKLLILVPKTMEKIRDALSAVWPAELGRAKTDCLLNVARVCELKEPFPYGV
jgi:hypothetical protein